MNFVPEDDAGGGALTVLRTFCLWFATVDYCEMPAGDWWHLLRFSTPARIRVQGKWYNAWGRRIQ